MTRRLPTQWSIRLHYPRPPKGLSANDRTHWAVKHAATQEVRYEVMAKVRAAKVPALDRIAVDVEWVVPDRRRRDSDNAAPLLKAIYDGIGADRGVSARIVEDDAPEFMDKRGLRIIHVPGSVAHFVVHITDLGEP
jgi:hypothetical protein